MTFAQLQAKVAMKLRTYGNLTWTPTDISTAINDGYREFCKRTLIARDQLTVTIAINTALYAFPTNTAVSAIIKVWRAEWDDVRLAAKDTLWMDEFIGSAWRTNTGTSLQYILTDSEDPDKIRIYPILDSADYIGTDTLKIDVSYLPVDLSATTDTPVIPTRYHDALVDYALSWLQELPVQSKQNPAMGDRAMQRFLVYVGNAIAEVNQGLIHNPYKRARLNPAFL